MRFIRSLLTVVAIAASLSTVAAQANPNVQVGVRPFFLVDDMAQSPLKDKLKQCEKGPFYKTKFSIGHRGGGTLQFPEETVQSIKAGVKMGAGVAECDVTFTKDKELVCRHSQCDLHTTTNIMDTPLAAKCSVQPDFNSATPYANVKCCTSDITVAEFKSLKGKMDGANSKATTVADYLKGTPSFRTDLYAANGTVLTHKEFIALAKELNVDMTPELKEALVPMPFDGMTQEMYAQKMINEYKQAKVNPKRVYAQSFNVKDVLYWIANEPAFGKQAVSLEDLNDAAQVQAATARIPQLVAQGVQIVAPPTWALVTLDANNKIVPSDYAMALKAAGLKIITWTLERSGVLGDIKNNPYYYQSVVDGIKTDGDTMVMLDVLAKDVGVIGVFSDWSATVTYYANCMGLK
jgi:glycerophosphoryl diester phosphodiesterase